MLAVGWGPSMAGEIRVAVASNFAEAARTLARAFEQRTGHQVRLSVGSTGKHYAQIHHGAPFEVFLAADAKRPMLLEKEGKTVPGSRFTYAVGQLVLWSPDPGLVDEQGRVLDRRAFRHLAIANPRLAPYGLAAMEVLQQRGLWDDLQRRFVRGENIGQTFQFVASGNADLGFVAGSQLILDEGPRPGSYWRVPPILHTPIVQQAVLVKNEPIAIEFLAFLESEEGKSIIHQFGYETP